MLYKEDWGEAKNRFEHWWRGEVTERVVLQVKAKRKNPISYKKEMPKPSEVLKIWSDPEYFIHKHEKVFAGTYYGGESFPNLWINLGPGNAATFMGSEPGYSEFTVWFNQVYKDWKEFKGLKYDPENKWWKIAQEITRRATAEMGDKYQVGIPDLGGVTDIAASLRDSQNLLMDLFDYPEKVMEMQEQILKLWYVYFYELEKIMAAKMQGMAAWMCIWSPTNWFPIQCDFSAMISPDMFEKFALPSLEDQCSKLERSIYHWDGPGQIPHLDMLLGIKKLNGIQWVPGAGKPHAGDPVWHPHLKKIQDAGKLLIIQELPPEAVEAAINSLNPKGLLISTVTETEEEAKELLKLAEVWTKRRMKAL